MSELARRLAARFDPPAPTGWEAENVRRTMWWRRDLLAAVQAEADATGVSLSGTVAELVAEALAARARSRSRLRPGTDKGQT